MPLTAKHGRCFCSRAAFTGAVLITLCTGATSALASQPPADSANNATTSPTAEASSVTARFTVTRFIVEGDNPLSPAGTEQALHSFVGAQKGLNDLIAASHALEDALRGHGYLFHRVVLPPQTIDHETVLLRVQPFKVGVVTVTGNKFFSSANVRRAVPQLQPGIAPPVQALSRSLLIANENPARHVALNLKESALPDAVDAEVAVQDRRTWTLFTNLNNPGTNDSGRTRLAIGAQHANLLGFDDALALSYTTSPNDTSAVKQWGANYKVPLYDLGGTVTAFYAHSDVDSGTIQNVFNVSGAGEFFGVSYTQYLWESRGIRQQIGIALDDREFTNNISFLGVPIGNDVRSRPASLRYEVGYRGEGLTAGATLSYVHNLHGGQNNDNASYQKARAGAAQHWDLFRFNGNAAIALPWLMQVRASFDAQQAGEPLIAGEQFGVGGSSSVRGFEERSVTGDDGQFGSLELWAPPSLFDVQLLGFVDGGHIKRANPQLGEVRADTVVSVGAGARWQWRGMVALSLDFGHAITTASSPGAGRNKLNFNLFVRY